MGIRHTETTFTQTCEASWMGHTLFSCAVWYAIQLMWFYSLGLAHWVRGWFLGLRRLSPRLSPASAGLSLLLGARGAPIEACRQGQEFLTPLVTHASARVWLPLQKWPCAIFHFGQEIYKYHKTFRGLYANCLYYINS